MSSHSTLLQHQLSRRTESNWRTPRAEISGKVLKRVSISPPWIHMMHLLSKRSRTRFQKKNNSLQSYSGRRGINTLAPSSARIWAVLHPMPDEAPVTSTNLFARGLAMNWECLTSIYKNKQFNKIVNSNVSFSQNCAAKMSDFLPFYWLTILLNISIYSPREERYMFGGEIGKEMYPLQKLSFIWIWFMSCLKQCTVG